MNLLRVWWGFGVVVVLAALVVCLVPGRELPAGFNINDKAGHLIGHGLMAVYFSGLVPRGRWWKIFVFLLLFGIVVEIAQYYMNVGRNGDPRDVIANSVGALLGLLLAWMGLARWPLFAAWVFGQRRAAE